MTKKTRMARISTELDSYLESMAKKMSDQSGIRISKAEASHIIALQARQPQIIIRKQKRKFVIGGSLVSL